MASQVTIEKLVYGGDGLARLDGQVVLTPFVLPGESVTVETTRMTAGLLRGSSSELLTASENRVEARCPYFGVCGGCQYQHAAYRYLIEQKVAILRETLQRLGGIVHEGEIPTITGEPWAYRNRIQLHFEKRQLGFRRAGSHALCAIDRCPISAPLLVEAIDRLQKLAKRREWPDFLRSLELFTNGSDLQVNVLESGKPVAARFFDLCREAIPSVVPGALEYRAAGCNFRIGGGSFFQVNRFLIDALVDEVIGDATGEHAVDLYAGVGLFSLPLAARFGRLEAVERGLSATRDLEHNSRQAGNISITRGSAEDYLKQLSGRPDLLVVDPPRAGLGGQAVSEILRIKPKRLTVVSCDPATLARDAKALLGAYRIRRRALVDLFPQTYHFETVVQLDISA